MMPGSNGPPSGDSVYMAPAPLLGMGTQAGELSKLGLSQKALPTIMHSDASDHPVTVETGAAFPELSYFDRALRGR
jgi:hypothetical protein